MIYFFELGNARSSFRLLLDFIEVINNPTDKFTSCTGIFKHKNRRTLHCIRDHRCFDTARQIQNFYSAIIRSNQRSLGSCHRNHIFFGGKFTIDFQRSCKTNRNLRDTRKMFDISRQNMRIKRIIFDVI